MIPSDISRHLRIQAPVWLYWDIGLLILSGTQAAFKRQARRMLRMAAKG